MDNCLFVPAAMFAADDAAALKRKEIAEKLRSGEGVNITESGEIANPMDLAADDAAVRKRKEIEEKLAGRVGEPIFTVIFPSEKEMEEKFERGAVDDAAALKRKELAEKLKRGQDVNITNFGFDAKMRILLANGTEKEIANCVVGESIFAIDQLTKKRKETQISEIVKEEVDQVIFINGILEVATSQNFYTHNFQRRRAHDLCVGDYVYNKDKELDQIIKLELVNEKTVVYNLSLSSVGDICVENFLFYVSYPIIFTDRKIGERIGVI